MEKTKTDFSKRMRVVSMEFPIPARELRKKYEASELNFRETIKKESSPGIGLETGENVDEGGASNIKT